MSEDCVCCVPVRFVNPSGDAVSDVRWVDKRLLKLKRLGIIVGVGSSNEKAPSDRKAEQEAELDAIAPQIDLELRQFDVLGVSPTFIDSHLVNDVRLRPHDARPKTLAGRIRQFWKSTEEQRHKRPFVSTFVGIVFVLGVFFIFRFLLGQLGILDHPFAAMVWIWAFLGSNLDDVVMLITLVIWALLAASRLYVISGLVLAAGLLVAIGASNLAQTLAEELPTDARWPTAYVFFWSEYKAIVETNLHPWLEWTGAIWPYATVLLNAIGLATFAEAVNQVIKLMTKPQTGEGIKVNPSNAMQNAQAGQANLLMNQMATPGFTSDDALLAKRISEALQLGWHHPVIPADLKPVGSLPLTVPPKPAHC